MPGYELIIKLNQLKRDGGHISSAFAVRLLLADCQLIKKKRMRSTQKLIELIKKRDVLAILAEDSLVEDFNELLKYELIDIVDDKIILTPKGEEARNIGLDEILTKLKIQEQHISSGKRNH